MAYRGNILIVDDSAALSELISEMLKAEDYNCMSVGSGEEAIEFLKSVKPDLILLDRTLPGMNGFEVCKVIKKNKEFKKIPIIFLTATNDVNDKVEGFKIGAVDYITKPFQKEELLARVNSHFELYKLSQLLKDQTESLKESEKNLKELNATKDKFFSIIAHDLKGPMNNILELSRFIKSKFYEGNKDEVEELLLHLCNTAETTNELLITLLDWASVQQGKMSYTPQVLNLFNVVNDSVRILSSNSRTKDISISVNIDEKTIVFADFNMVQTILRNLISNAIKFTPKGGSITLHTNICEDMVNVCVSDNGIGIDAKNAKNLFMINRAKSSYGTEGETGTGLGLILCKEFVEKNRGNIWVESQLGNGTSIWFSLPAG